MPSFSSVPAALFSTSASERSNEAAERLAPLLAE